MTRYAVELRGENFLLDINGEPRKFGFRFKKFVMAEDPTQAERIAVISVHKSPEIRDSIMNSRSDPPRIHAVNTVQTGFWTFFRNKRKKAFDFYEEGEPET